MILSILIPVYNEEKTVKKLLEKVVSVKLPKSIVKEIIIVDDGSTDGSFQKIISYSKRKKNIRVFRHHKNTGKGAAIKTAIKKSKGDILVVQDADLEYDPNDLSRLVAPIAKSQYKVVYGSRLKNYPVKLFGKNRTPLLTHFVGNKMLTFITNLLFRKSLSDMETCYKVFHKSVLKGINIQSKKFNFEPEITAKILKKGYEIHEIPIKVNPRGYDEGKKITWKDGFSAIWTLLKYRFMD